jgi:hypothetical protein
MSGDILTVPSASPRDTLHEFYDKLARVSGTPRATLQLISNEGTRFTVGDLKTPLGSLGIVKGSELWLIRRNIIEVTEMGLRVEIQGAGSDMVNGVYCKNEANTVHTRNGLVGSTFFRQREGVIHRIRWYKESFNVFLQRRWPSGWYIETIDFYGIYYHEGEDPNILPLDGWEVYQGDLSRPGLAPAPMLSHC